jgi:hypothetical protein
MSGLVIKDLHQGMNLRDPAIDIAVGEVGETLGCDFSTPGEIRPMREPLLAWTMPEDIQDAHIVWLETTQYLFTTHADGLRVTSATGGTLLINASFTGLFKVLAINGAYVFLSNVTTNIKWKPSYGAATYQMGLNTPPAAPTLSSGGAGSLSGSFWVAYAYENDLFNYGAYTDYSTKLALTNEKLVISNLVPDTDSQTIKRRLAIVGGGGDTPMVYYLKDNTSTSVTIDSSDITAMVDEELYFNNHPPPVGIKDMRLWSGRIFLVTGDNKLYYSVSLIYEAFPYLNYRAMSADEQLQQVAVVGQAIATRGLGGEYLTQLVSYSTDYWQDHQGAHLGAVTSRLLINDISNIQVYASRSGLYGNTVGPYLPKINVAIVNQQKTKGNPEKIFGDYIADRAYLYFEDIDGVDRVMRIDYRLLRPVAHYVANFKPSCIFADRFNQKVYYALGTYIYEFDAGEAPMDTKLIIPENLMGFDGEKDFGPLNYELETSSLSMQIIMDRQIKPEVLTLPTAVRERDPISLPPLIGQQMGMILTSTAAEYTIYLPWQVQWAKTNG